MITVAPGDICILGPNAELHHCTLSLASKRDGFLVTTSRLYDCAIVAKKQVKEVEWSAAQMTRCKFVGEFSSCDFGPRPDLGGRHTSGFLRDVDFRSALLDACRFFSTNLDDVLLPGWPIFTIVNHEAAARDFRNSSLSDAVFNYANDLADTVEGQVALCLNALKEVKQLRCEEIVLHDFLNLKPYVLH